jgi:hypothetical protein
MPNTQNYREQGGASDVIGLEGTLDIKGTLKKDGGDVTEDMVFTKVITATLAEIKAGKTLIVNPSATKKIMIVGGEVKAAGTAATATSVDIEDTANAKVAVMDVAGLADGAIFDLRGEATANIATTLAVALGAGLDVQAKDIGTALTGTTSIRFILDYKIVSP